MIDNVMVVIRSVGERTEETCKRLVCAEVPKEHVKVIHEYPFGAAVRKTFRVGIEKELPWTLALDADVLLRRGAVSDLIAWADNRASKNTFRINPQVADKLLGRIRPAGVHLYRTSLLKKALNRAKADIDDKERPETLVRMRMSEIGYMSCMLEGLIVGLHAFEQSLIDIYRTSYVHWLKHTAAAMERCKIAWSRLADEDVDFQVALAGATISEVQGGMAIIDARLFPDTIQEISGFAEFQEKEPLPPDQISFEDVARGIGEFSPFTESIRSRPTHH